MVRFCCSLLSSSLCCASPHGSLPRSHFLSVWLLYALKLQAAQLVLAAHSTNQVAGFSIIYKFSCTACAVTNQKVRHSHHYLVNDKPTFISICDQGELSSAARLTQTKKTSLVKGWSKSPQIAQSNARELAIPTLYWICGSCCHVPCC